MISNNDEFVQVAQLNNDGDLVFTPEYLEAMKEVSHLTRRFASQLMTHFGNEYTTLLDYFGPDDTEKDIYSGIDGEPMNVREDITDLWEFQELSFESLQGEWYRDVLRAKLASLRLPKKLITQFVKAAKKAK